jgi:disulfide bond formation protein DsbB
MGRILSPRVLPWAVAAAAGLILAFVHIIEAFGWPPCELCLRQRIPYWVALGLAIAAGAAGLPRLKLPAILTPILMAFVAATFITGIGLAIQHIGVEEGWWLSTCSTGHGPTKFIDLMNTEAMRTIVPCDEKRPFLLGLTLADYNLIVSIVLAAISASLPVRTFAGGRRTPSMSTR